MTCVMSMYICQHTTTNVICLNQLFLPHLIVQTAASPTAVPASVTEDEMARRQRNRVVRVSLLNILAEGILLVDGTM